MRKNQAIINSDGDLDIKIGTILFIDEEAKRADVLLDDETILSNIEFFYHCMPDDVENGYKAFFTGARILVSKNKHIIGFEDLKPKACADMLSPVRLLTFNIVGFNIKSKSFCVVADESCDVVLHERERIIPDPRIRYVSQCRYVHGSGEAQKILSLFHYDSYEDVGSPLVNKVIRLISHNENMKDFVLKIETSLPGSKVYLYGALSADLETLYVSVFYSKYGPTVPRTEWQLYYSRYDFIGGDWVLTKTGETPIKDEEEEPLNYSFQDNALDRTGKCGCWYYADEFETLTYEGTFQGVNCLVIKEGGWQVGTRAKAKYKTFDITTETFIESEKRVGLHLSSSATELVTCKAAPNSDYFYKLPNGNPNQFTECAYSCDCSLCPPPAWWWISDHEIHTEYKVFYGGWSREYKLFNGLVEFITPWGEFFYEGLNTHKILNESLSGGCIGPPGQSCVGDYYEFVGGAMRALSVPFTSVAYTGYIRLGNEYIQTGGYQVEGDQISGRVCGDKPAVRWWVPHRTPCGYALSTIEQSVDEDGMEMLSPFEMDFEFGDVVGNTFISYDEETGCFLRGVHYKKVGVDWVWKIFAKFPGCTEQDVTNEFKNQLPAEDFYNIEAMVYLDQEL